MGRLNIFHFIVLISSSLFIEWTFCSDDHGSIYPLPDPIIPEECLSKHYCEHVPNYPEEIAARLVAKVPILVTKLTTHAPVRVQLCKVNKTKVTPKAAKDITGRWHYILNPKDNPVQWYQEIKCIPDRRDHDGLQSCGDDMLFFNNSLGRCQQRTSIVVYKTIDRFGQVNVTGNFPVLCCCVCNGYIEPIK
ncbi:spaetzle domain-containing protein [Phthorimaea operculella]|nr:spaetzle domain-containing protein [Phthorimaea operculella]